ncbi:hypothetical protein P4S72_13415 [Vibrio sp. PP-XX7]
MPSKQLTEGMEKQRYYEELRQELRGHTPQSGTKTRCQWQELAAVFVFILVFNLCFSVRVSSACPRKNLRKNQTY